MADNVTLNAGSGGDVIAADDVSSVKYQIVKLAVGGNGVAAMVSNSDPLPISDAGGSITVDGSVTANAGTNLNTSALALESGGNLAGAATSLAIIDDWDETDRAKVNPIVGQAGVQGGSGTVSALTQRVVLATDVALPAGTNAIGKLAANSGVDIGDVDVTSCALPTGASTAAKQPALGTAGSASTDVITVQGIAAMTPLLVTASAGTNLNTSALALESGGNLAAAAASLSVVDDWDESDRAKVNPIVGQAGVQGGSGTVSALTQRVVLATDVALPAGTNAIGKLAANSGVDIGDVDVTTMPAVAGAVAHDAAASGAGNPVYTGGYATNSIEGITQVANADVTRVVHDLNGVQVVRPHTTLEELISERVTNTDGASTAFSNFAAGGSGVHNYVTQVSIWNSSSTDGFVDFRDGTGGAVKWTFPAPQTGGCNMTFDPPLKFADNTAVAYDASGAISTIYISVNGFQAQG